MQDYLEFLKEKGYKLTKQRCKILECLEKHPSLSAEEILSLINQEIEVNLSTIYRNLNLLLQMGLIRKSNQLSQSDYFELVRQNCSHDLLCLACGDKVSFSTCTFNQLAKEIESETKYQVKHHNFEIYGLCPKCIPEKN